MKFYYLLFILLLTAFINFAFSQNLTKSQKKAIIDQQTFALSDYHNQKIGFNNSFINGRLHIPAYFGKSHQYLKNNWAAGQITYKGNQFSIDEKKLKYDILHDELIYLHFFQGQVYNIALNKEFVTKFEINNKKYVYLSHLQGGIFSNYPAGYYHVLYDGHTKLYKKWTKTEIINSSKSVSEYEMNTQLLLVKKSKVHKVKSMLKAMFLLRDKRKQISKFVNANNLNNRGKELSTILPQILNYYDSIQ